MLLILSFWAYYSGAIKAFLANNDIDFSTYYLFQLNIFAFSFYFFSFRKINAKILIFIATAVSILFLNYSSKSLARDIFTYFELHNTLYSWFKQTFINFQKAIALLVPLVLTYLIQRRSLENFYGLSKRNFEAKPYLLMLLVMLPLIFAASFEPSFQRMYPRYKPGMAEEIGIISEYLSIGIFEATYGLRFLGVEVFWRGFLVIGGVALLGKRAILPAACLYSVWHFGKPMGEAIGAFFGGYILGILAYRTRSIYGGIAIHYGVALLMELAAWSQILFF
jgi:hypothetical protein